MQIYVATPDNEAQALYFLQENEVTLPLLLDPTRVLKNAYDLSEAGEQSAPYPIHVVIDADGIVRLLSVDSDLGQVHDAIADLLARR